MKLRVLPAAAVLAALAPLAVLAGCAPRPHPVADPVLTPTGAETLPVWVRQADGAGSNATATATLTIPADLLFAKDSADLTAAAVTVLRQVLGEAGRTGARTVVEGYADSDGDAAHNQVLSERRAAAVADWLVGSGVAPASITTRGWGETRPAVEETDEAAKARNRRVVVTVTGPQGRSDEGTAHK